MGSPPILSDISDWVRRTAPSSQSRFRHRSEAFERVIRSTPGIDPRVADTVLRVPRHEFVRPSDVTRAYANRALSIGKGQTISQPSLVAHMISELRLSEKACAVLDVGAGSGYQSAILSHLAERVIAVELIPELAASAENRLRQLGYQNVEVRTAVPDTVGFPAGGPYDGIIVGARAPQIPSSLCQQLAPGARLVIPIGESQLQRVATVLRHAKSDEFIVSKGIKVLFVPLILPESECQ